MEEALRALLLPVIPVHWSMAPQGSIRPFAVLSRVSGGRDYTTDGRSSSRPARVQVDVYGETYAQTKLLARRVTQQVSGRRLDGFAAIMVVGEIDNPAGDAIGSGTDFRTVIDLMIHHQTQE